jgi:hypothetical protein
MLIYEQFKLSHSGVTKYTVFENVPRKVHHHSLQNLLNYTQITGEILESDIRKEKSRNLNPQQSKKVKRYCSKLSYYSGVRKFKSKKGKTYSMRVAFLTLTAPESTTHKQFLKAFDHFLDYLRRTANCVFVWKKELGEKNGKLHVHIMINNFIPYYIVSWKWKRLLISEGVKWPLNEKGKDTNSHTRIELPHSIEEIGHYMSKYMSKAFELDQDCGYIWGKSKILDDCKEGTFTESELNSDELRRIGRAGKIVGDSYVTHVCIDLLKVKKIAPKVFEIFNEQYTAFCEKLTLPVNFEYV